MYTARATAIGDTTAEGAPSSVRAQVMSVTNGMAAARRERSARKGNGAGAVSIAVCVTTKRHATRRMVYVSAGRDLGEPSVK